MKLTRPKFKDKKTGKIKKCSKWRLDFIDNAGIRRRLPLFPNKAASQRTASMIEELLSLSYGGVMSADLQRRLNSLPDKVRTKLILWGLASADLFAEHNTALPELVDEYAKFIAAKGDTRRHVVCVRNMLNRTIKGCGFKAAVGIKATVLANYLIQRRESEARFSARTSNAYLTTMRCFCNWLIRTRVIAAPNPLLYLPSMNERTDRRRVRRVLEVDEVKKLLKVTKAGPELYGMDGKERALLYRFAIESGLRVNELRSLTVGSFDFENLTVTVQAGCSKRRRLDVLPVRSGTAKELKAFFQGKLPTAKAFGGSYKAITDKTSLMIKADLEAAGLEYIDDDGHVFDFHSLRHQTATFLAATGTDVKTVQSLMRHSDVNLTMNIYSHVLRGSEAKALEALPDLSVSDDEEEEQEKKTA